MDIETAARAAYHVRQLEEKELKRKKIASWYVMLPGIPVQEKRKRSF